MDFSYCQFFTAAEIIATGAKIEDVRFDLIMHLDHFRGMLGSPVSLLHNGLTTGDHTSEQHKSGIAVDFSVEGAPLYIFKLALLCGFRGIGIYHNGTAYSYHCDLRETHAFWTAWKKEHGEPWNYDAFLNDPILKAKI